jgi:hypothetical protein
MTIDVAIPSGAAGFAEDKDAARSLRLRKLLPALERGDDVRLDFAQVKYATQSYIHSLIGEALQRYGESALDRFEFKNCSPSVRSVIELVVDYSLGGFPDQEAV